MPFLAKNLKLLSFSFGSLYNLLSFPPLETLVKKHEKVHQQEKKKDHALISS